MKYDVCGIQISLLLLLLTTGICVGGDSWTRKPEAKKTSPSPPPQRVAETAPPPREATDLAPVYKSPWPDFNANYQAVATFIRQTDDIQHQRIWGWFSNHPILQFLAIILLSGAILAIARLWLRQCCASANKK